MKISHYLNVEHICFLHAKTRDEALKELSKLLTKSGTIKDQEHFFKAILDREKIVSTGIGMGVAIPHAKLKEFDQFFIALGIQKEGGLDWNALDKAPVKLIFMIGGPDDKQTEYLQILSSLTHLIKNEQLRKKLLTIDNQSTALKLFENF